MLNERWVSKKVKGGDPPAYPSLYVVGDGDLPVLVDAFDKAQ